MSSLQNSIELISAAKDNDIAMNRLVSLIAKEHMPKRVSKYYKRNVLVEQADIDSAFLFACYQAVGSAKIDVGNPLLYVLWKGELAVIQLFRKEIPKGVSATCPTCETTVSLARRNGKNVCSVCGSTDIKTFMKEIGDSQLTDTERAAGKTSYDRAKNSDPYRELDALFSMNIYDITVEEMRSHLTGRVRELFDILVIEGVNRESSDNYLGEIAKRWGVSTACVSVYLRKLRVKIINYYAQD